MDTKTKFEVGKTYYATNPRNHECAHTIKVIKRTDKTLTYEHEGRIRRSKLRAIYDRTYEYVRLVNYSMAPIFYSTKEQTATQES